ncbi:hypothetical protein GGI07_004460 [Coemansia sp. Benny D115]|nr:hypothetical protein GGI07_004460 [Coemansia sp. Benny D115]
MHDLVKRHKHMLSMRNEYRNKFGLVVDTRFMIAHTTNEPRFNGILSIYEGDIIRVKHGTDSHPRWWEGEIISSYVGNKGSGIFFPVLTEDYHFADARLAPRIPMVLLGLHANSRARTTKQASTRA